MIVCVCNQVSDREIKRSVSAGMTFSDIQLELGVATCCGSCESCASELVARAERETRQAGSATARATALGSGVRPGAPVFA